MYEVYDSTATLVAFKKSDRANLEITISGQKPGKNKFYVIAKITGCSDVLMQFKPVLEVNEGPKTDLEVTCKTITCSDSNNFIYVKNSIDKTEYTVYTKAGVKVGNTLVGNNSDLEFNLGVLPVGVNEFYIGVSVAGCSFDTLDTKPSITINKRPSSGTRVDNNSPICINNSAVLNIQKETNVAYSVYRRKYTLDSLLGTTTNSTFVTSNYTKAGVDTLLVHWVAQFALEMKPWFNCLEHQMHGVIMLLFWIR
jgi:hypothetical protein